MKDTGGNVAARSVLGHQVLNVGLAKHAATRGNGVDALRLQGQAVEFVNAHIEQYGHLVDKRSRASGAVAVHAQVGALALAEEHHFGVLAAYVNHRCYLWMLLLHVACGAHHFLYEGQSGTFRQAHAYAARYGEADGHVAHRLAQRGE